MAYFARPATNLLRQVALYALLSVPFCVTQAQDYAMPAVESAKLKTLEELSRSHHVPVRLSRREDLEDLMLQVALKKASELRSPLFIYEVQTPRFAVDRGEVVQMLCNDGCNVYRYVAIANDGSSVYRLFGFNDALANFNRMAEWSHLDVRNRADAETYAGFCLEVAFGIRTEERVVGESDAQLHAARYYLSKDVDHGLDQAKRWWSLLSKDKRRIPLEIQTTEQASGFEVKIPIFSVSNDKPLLKLAKLSISTNGACKRLPD